MSSKSVNMKWLVITCAVFANVINVGKEVQAAIEEYYWKDFNGAIPSDAFPAGMEANGNPIYIGQVLYSVYLVPAQIYQNGKISFEYEGLEHHNSASMKILCSKHPEQFRWIITNNEDIYLLTDKHLVIGGYDKPGTTTYLGRVRTGAEVTVGKVLSGMGINYAGLHIAKNGFGEKYTSFAVLAYNPLPTFYETGISKIQGCKQVSISFYDL